MIKAYTDGACRISNPGLCSAAFVVYGEENVHNHKQGRVLPGLNTNNIAEYTALIDLLQWADKNTVRNIVIHCDSKLVVEQVNRRWDCLKPELKGLCSLAYGLLVRGGHMLKHVKGHSGVVGNEAVDALCNELLDEYQKNKESVLEKPI